MGNLLLGGVARQLLIAVHWYHTCDLSCSSHYCCYCELGFLYSCLCSPVFSDNAFPNSELCSL